MIASMNCKVPATVSNMLAFAKVIYKYNPATLRHERGELFKYWAAQETNPGKSSLIPQEFMTRFTFVKKANNQVVLEFVRNYFMPVGEGAGGGIIQTGNSNFPAMTLDYDWTSFHPHTKDLHDAGFAQFMSGAKQVPVSKWCVQLFLLWQVRLVFSSVLTHAWEKQNTLATSDEGTTLHNMTYKRWHLITHKRSIPLPCPGPMCHIGSGHCSTWPICSLLVCAFIVPLTF